MEQGHLYDTSLWRSNADDCIWAIFDDACVVFHRPSGKTHFLNAAGHRLLTEILDQPERTVAIAHKLAISGSGETGAEDMEEVHTMLVRFEYLGLVDRLVIRP